MRRTRALTAVAVVVTALLAGCGGGDSSSSGSSSGAAGSSSATPGSSAGPTLQLVGGAAAKCVVPNPTTLARMQTAFAGTATQVDGDRAVLHVDRWYSSGQGGTVTVETTGPTISEPGLRRLVEGRRYLISGQQGQVSLCGFSAPWSPRLAQMYAEAFPR